MKSTKLTQLRFEQMHPAEQLKTYCSHPNNQVFNRNRPDGLCRVAQANLWNNWQETLSRFGQSLPAR